MILTTVHAAQIIANDENFQLKNGLPEYLLASGAKLYPPKRNQAFWRIVGYTTDDLENYQVFAIN